MKVNNKIIMKIKIKYYKNFLKLLVSKMSFKEMILISYSKISIKFNLQHKKNIKNKKK